MCANCDPAPPTSLPSGTAAQSLGNGCAEALRPQCAGLLGDGDGAAQQGGERMQAPGLSDAHGATR